MKPFEVLKSIISERRINVKKFCLLMMILLCTACAKVQEMPKLLPTDVISLSEAQSIVGDEYTLVMKDDAVTEIGNLLTVKYLSEPEGEGDPIFVEVRSKDGSGLKNEFKKSYEKRTDSILVQGLADEAYITYPSLHMYINDFYVKITAGSGSSDEQAELLVELGKLAEANINAFFEENNKNLRR